MLCDQPPLVAAVDEQPTRRSNLVDRRFHGALPSIALRQGAYRGEGCKGTGFALKPGSPHCISPKVAHCRSVYRCSVFLLSGGNRKVAAPARFVANDPDERQVARC